MSVTNSTTVLHNKYWNGTISELGIAWIMEDRLIWSQEMSIFIHTAGKPLRLLLAACPLPEGLAFESLNEDLLLTGLWEWHLFHRQCDHIHICVVGNTLSNVLVSGSMEDFVRGPLTQCLQFILINLMNSRKL